LATREFGQRWQGHGRVQGIRDWVLERTTFSPNTSNSQTSAIDTLLEQVGVCRDFAHLMIAPCRAVNIPVRFGTGRDAVDVAFATIFGSVQSAAPVISITAISGVDGQLVVPCHCVEALSTDE